MEEQEKKIPKYLVIPWNTSLCRNVTQQYPNGNIEKWQINDQRIFVFFFGNRRTHRFISERGSADQFEYPTSVARRSGAIHQARRVFLAKTAGSGLSLNKIPRGIDDDYQTRCDG